MRYHADASPLDRVVQLRRRNVLEHYLIVDFHRRIGSPAGQLHVEPDVAAERAVRCRCDLRQLSLDEFVERRLTGGANTTS